MYRLFFVEFEMMKSFHKRPGVDDDNDGDGDVIRVANKGAPFILYFIYCSRLL